MPLILSGPWHCCCEESCLAYFRWDWYCLCWLRYVSLWVRLSTSGVRFTSLCPSLCLYMIIQLQKNEKKIIENYRLEEIRAALSWVCALIKRSENLAMYQHLSAAEFVLVCMFLTKSFWCLAPVSNCRLLPKVTCGLSRTQVVVLDLFLPINISSSH